MATTSRYMTPDQTAAFRVASEQAAAALHALDRRHETAPILRKPTVHDINGYTLTAFTGYVTRKPRLNAENSCISLYHPL